ncbi:MAG: hypothetical protein WCO71_12445, partial [Pseudomonadota bacterium]
MNTPNTVRKFIIFRMPGINHSWALSLLFALCLPGFALADVSIYESYIIINGVPGSSGDYYFKLKDNGASNTSFASINQSLNLLASPSLTLKGGQTKTTATSGDYQNNTNYETLFYRFYDSTAVAPSYSNVALTYNYDNSNPAYPNYIWGATGSTVNLISGLASGTFYMDVYDQGNGSYFSGSQQYFTSPSNTYGSSGSPLRATFALYYGANATGTQSAAFTCRSYFNFNGAGSTDTLNATDTYTGETQIDAGTVAITG